MRGFELLKKILLALVLWVVIPTVLAEGVLRLLIFSDLPAGEAFRKPALYTSYNEEDYWKLKEIFQPRGPLPNGHPVLGWFTRGDLDSLLHEDAAKVADRRPVLLYGDSFAACYPLDECVEDQINQDLDFERSCHLLNYAVSGYGLDQIYNLMDRSVDLYENPFVVFGVTTIDLPRSLLPFRGRPKPTYVTSNGQIELVGAPVELDVARFLDENPVSISSYLYRLALHGRAVPNEWRRSLSGEADRVEREEDLSRALLQSAVRSLRERGVDFLFLVFSGEKEIGVSPTRHATRVRLIIDVLETEGVPYISMPDQILAATTERQGKISDYFLVNNAHPNEEHVGLVTEALLERLTVCGSKITQ